MKALLLAAGQGTRLRPMTDVIPKCLVPIHGRPLLELWLERLQGAGIGPVFVNMHHLAERVLEYLGSSPYRDLVVPILEPILLGTGGTLLENRNLFGGEPLLLIHADNLSVFDVRAFVQRHAQRPIGCELTMMTFRTSTPRSCGIVELDDRGVVQAFHEKCQDPPGNLANGAVYMMEPSILDFLEGLGKAHIDFSTEVLPHFLGRIYTFHNDIFHMDIGTPESYRDAQEAFLPHLPAGPSGVGG